MISVTLPASQMFSGKMRKFEINATSLGLEHADVAAVRGGSPKDNAKIFRDLLDGQIGPVRNIVALNAAAGIVVAGKASDMKQGLEILVRVVKLK